MLLSNINSNFYTLSHLIEEDVGELKNFRIDNSKGKGLEYYLKEIAIEEESSNNARTYLIKDKESKEIVAYFTLKAGLITRQINGFKFNSITGIELANFAVSDAYRKCNDVIPQLGKYIFITFIYPLVKEISEKVGAQCLYIFALPHNKLMKHYSGMGFARFPRKLEKFIHRHIRPVYDKGCIFMYQKIV